MQRRLINNMAITRRELTTLWAISLDPMVYRLHTSDALQCTHTHAQTNTKQTNMFVPFTVTGHNSPHVYSLWPQ